jgi:hypothetical protein
MIPNWFFSFTRNRTNLDPMAEQALALLSLGYSRHFFVSSVKTHGSGLLYSQALMPPGLHARQNPFFLLLFNVTFRYGNGGGFLGSLTIGFRSSLPSANVMRRKRSSPCCTTSILVAVFAMAQRTQFAKASSSRLVLGRSVTGTALSAKPELPPRRLRAGLASAASSIQDGA